jgi:predicted phage terminase large subunit-like protein
LKRANRRKPGSKAGKPLTFRQFVSLVRPRYQWYLHCERLAAVLQKVADGEIKRLMVFMPPRHGKSEEVSRLFAAYFLYRFPERWVGINSYAADLAFTLSRAARENYTEAGGKVKADAAAVKHWETGQGGGMWAAGVGGPITGKGFHLGIIDDPLKNAEEAASETIREKQKEWYSSTFYTREEPWSDTDPNGAIIVIQTRWHEDDLAGWLLSEETQIGDEGEEEPERWHIVNFEAIKEDCSPEVPASCTLEPDWRKAGEALCPERRPIEKLRKIAARIGSYFFGALFQQKPTPKEGSFFKVGAIEIVDVAPAQAKMTVRAWDLGATEGDGDFTAGVKMSEAAGGIFYVHDVRRGQWGPDTADAEIKQTAAIDGRQVSIHGAQDPGAAGKRDAQAFVRMLSGFTVETELVSGPKEARARAFASQVNAGNVKLVKGEWNRAFIEELRAFPRGKKDDQVDAAADAFNKLTGGGWGKNPGSLDELRKMYSKS